MPPLLTHRLVTALTNLFGQLDDRTIAEITSRIQPVSLRRGEILYRQGDPGTTMHLVLTGRLQVRVRSEELREKIVAYLSPGESAGEMALFTGARRAATVVAIRDTTLGLLTRETFDAVMVRRPEAVLDIARLIIGRLTETQTRGASRAPLRNIALIAIDRTANLAEFGRRLQLALLKFGSTAYLDSSAVSELLGVERPASKAPGTGPTTEVGNLLDEYEHTHDYVICEGDLEPTEWTRKCVGYADKILLVGATDAPPQLSALETELFHDSRALELTEKELVLGHRDTASAPSGTGQWLNGRQLGRHHHVPWKGNAGFNRLARRLSNNAVTVVLGGGGARGFAHIGCIRAIREAGIPIDAVGGTSFGALVAATVALGYSDERLLDEMKSTFVDDRPMDDYTLPIVSLLKGERLVSTLKKRFGDIAIEDTWIPFFAVSSNLSKNRVEIHTSGPLWKALRATVSLPGIFPPCIEKGDLLVDGGLLNNLPVDIMKEMVAGKTIAVDVSVDEEYRVEREALPSPYEYLKAKVLSNEREALQVPTLNRVMIKATTLGRSRSAQAVKSGADLHLDLPVRDFDLLGWDRFHDIVEAGYQYTKGQLNQWLLDHRNVVQRDEVFDSRLSKGDG